LIAMAVPDASTWGVINSGDTAPVAAEVSGMLRIAQAPDHLRELCGWAAAEREASSPHTQMGQRASPSAVTGAELVARWKKWLVYQAGQVVCRPVNHS